MNKPIKIYQFHEEALRWKFKLANRKGIQCEVKWCDLKPGWGKTCGWGMVEVKENNK